MEETVGAWWDKIVSKLAYSGFTEARVELHEVAPIAAILYQALGGDAGLQIQSGTARQHGARLGWLQRIAGIGERQEGSWRTERELFLPSFIDYFPSKELNRELYLWLLILLAHDCEPEAPWLLRNQAATLNALQHLPAFQQRYQDLVECLLQLRQQVYQPSEKTQAIELQIAQALRHPGSVKLPLELSVGIYPVICWMTPHPPAKAAPAPRPTALDQQENQAQAQNQQEQKQDLSRKKPQAEHTDMPEPKSPFMLLFRAESLFSWAEYVKVNRDLDEDDNPDAARAAEDLDILSIANDGKSLASRLRFDLDLPAEAEDDLILTEGLRYPEWDFKKQSYREHYAHVELMLARHTEQEMLPVRLHVLSQKLRRQFQCLQPQQTLLKAQAQGDEIDIDACVRFLTEPSQQAHARTTLPQVYTAWRRQQRDLACLLLADLSMSTDAAVDNQQRIIDVIRDSLYLFSEALDASGDKFALYGFSSVRRHHVRMHLLKGFDERYSGAIRARIAEIKPGFYTRMGAAVRHASATLQLQSAERRLLLILTDGKPNDLDHYEGRYGIEDTRIAIQEAREAGLIPFCVTVDDGAQDYLPHLFGANGFTIVKHINELPTILPRLYVQLTSH
ncbi:VWA domain-containing protein [Undibacterium cyanobacteriorum]|uniref:VWA domain-containing protein n=1 Tax=Undibacterium cyanobacteriorum TaxID=3073561 RepID=A0ABY9RGA2_9BURK|nr:VWA domain-containing protein [Undibacterium sp. 20NA77.5]WMW80237.1 VWA domain-containing protein [Undibacterium sp. 20NA77.5]